MFLYYFPSSKCFMNTKLVWGMGGGVGKRWRNATIVCRTQAKTHFSPSLFPAEELVAGADQPVALTLHFLSLSFSCVDTTQVSCLDHPAGTAWDSPYYLLFYMEDCGATKSLMSFLGSWLSQDHSVVVYLLPRYSRVRPRNQSDSILGFSAI